MDSQDAVVAMVSELAVLWDTRRYAPHGIQDARRRRTSEAPAPQSGNRPNPAVTLSLSESIYN